MEERPTKSTSREVVEGLVEAGASVVPFAGGPMGVALAFAMGYSYNRRMGQWLDDLAEAVTELQERTDGLAFEELAADETFVDAVVHASRAAQATHQQDKLNALRNGVLNSLGPDAPTLDEQARFFRLVEEFTGSHLRLLAFLDDPGDTLDRAGIERQQFMYGGRGTVLELLPDFRGRRDWYDLLMGDLSAAYLTGAQLHATQTGASLYDRATTDLGRRFLAFITAPPTLNEL